MARTKIDYGIDLGTTNSAISRMENGEPVIIKTDESKDTVPSCAGFKKNKSMLVGGLAYKLYRSERQKALTKGADINSFIEFKRTMGTNKKYYSSYMERNYMSEELSAEVLKKLKSFVTDESIKSIVITVPAKFTINQNDATVRAAKLAGFEHCELLHEPIAASMAYGIDAKSKDGFWFVFDFGGGTFDAALLKVEDGIMKVIDTEGDNYLGGKNLDYAIVDDIMIPYLSDNYSIQDTISQENTAKKLKDALKFWAEDIKNQLSFKDEYNLYVDPGDAGEDDKGEEIEIDLTVNQGMMKNTIGPIFQKAIDISKGLLKRNNLTGDSLDSLILVGGPTYSPILRKMLEEQIRKPDVSLDPMIVVSKGAALFASTIDVSEEIKEQQRDKTKIQLDFCYEATTVEEEEFVAIKILKDKTEGDIPDKVFVDIVRGDKAWSSGKVEIDNNGEVIEIKLDTNKPNAFNVYVFNEQGDLLESEPSFFTIIQGSKTPPTILPYHVGVEIKDRSSGEIVFRSIKGLEKNQSTPATGIINGLKTQQQIRPGIKDDSIKIPIYQGEHGAEGTKAIYNEHVYDVIISGEDLPSLLPEGSNVDLTVKVNRSGEISLSAFFSALEYSHDIKVPSNTTQSIDESWLESEISKAQQALNLIRQEGIYSDTEELNRLDSEISETKKNFEHDRTDVDRQKQSLNNLRRSLIKLDKIRQDNEWPKTEKELKEVFYRLEETSKKFGDEKTNALIKKFKEQIPVILNERDVKVAQELIDNMRSLDYALIDQGYGVKMEIMYLNNFNDEFETIDWKDKKRARMTLDRGLQMAKNNPTKEKLRPVVIELFQDMYKPNENIKCPDCGNPIKNCVCHLKG
jgi:molecular chaperone DnaK